MLPQLPMQVSQVHHPRCGFSMLVYVMLHPLLVHVCCKGFHKGV